MSSSPSTETPKTSEPERAPSTIVDPGQIIRINAHFPNEPANILFSFLAPGAAKAHHDLGIHDISSKIIRDGNLYSFWIDTQGMQGGEGWWYFFSQDSDLSKRRAKVGTFIVNYVPVALLDRSTPETAVTLIGGYDDDGLSLLGAEAHDDAANHGRILVAAGVGLVIGLALSL